MSGGPFDVQSDIVFGNSGWNYGGSAGGTAQNSPYQGYSPNVTQTPTSEATGTGSIVPSGSVPAQTTPGSLTSTSSSSTLLYIGLAAAAVGVVWYIYKHKGGS
jgi:hypothetical protein